MAFRLSARAGRAIAATAGLVLAFDAAYAAANWTVSLTSGTTGGEAQAASVQNLTITASASPAAGNLLYPGGNGDVVASINNPNAFPVTITALQLPADTVYATGYTDSALSTAATGCDSTASTVTWNLSTATSGTSVALTTALVVPAAGSLVVTLTDEAVMGASAPSACEGKYFSMPALIGVTATGGAATATTSPTTDTY